jgi:glycosyltransferase involved in cell wall biosynthesis
MRILMVHNHYLIRGGEDECVEAELRLLRAAGHEVDLFTETNSSLDHGAGASAALRALWSTESHRAIGDALSRTRYDLIHVHNFFPRLSPAVHYAARSAGVPVVQTIHNYRLLCANAHFYRDRQPCESCLGRVMPWPAIVHRCYRQSAGASAAVGAMLTLHRALDTWNRTVDVYVAPSEFVRRKLVAGGLPAERIVVKPHFVDPDPGAGGGGGHALFIGRLSDEKGAGTLLKAWTTLGPKLPLTLVGSDGLGPGLASQAARLPGVRWLGTQPMSEVHSLMRDARMVVVPSECYETFGRVVIEAFAAGTPVVASRIGAVEELIDEGRTGLLFRAGDVEDLVAKVERLCDDRAALTAMRAAARHEFERRYTAERNYAMLMEIYTRAQARPFVAASRT